MMTKSNTSRRLRKGLHTLVAAPMLTLLLTLTACGDKEAPIDPTHQVQLAEARAATERERSLRQLAEDRLGTVRLLAVLGVGGALALGLAMGSSSRRKVEGAQSEGDRAEGVGTDDPDLEGARTEV